MDTHLVMVRTFVPSPVATFVTHWTDLASILVNKHARFVVRVTLLENKEA